MQLTFTDFAGPSKEAGEELCFKDCPVCGSTRWKTYLNPATGWWYCFAGEHSGGGRVDTGMPVQNRGHDLLLLLERHADQMDWPTVQMPEWQRMTNRARRYLAKRSITDDEIVRYGMVEDADRMRVVVPYRWRDGRIIYWNARKYSELEDGPKYMAAPGKHPLFVTPGYFEDGPVWIVEGLFDAIVLQRHVPGTVVALGGKSLPRYLYPDLLALCAGDKTYVLLDGEATTDALKLRARLADKLDIQVVPLPYGTDPADLDGRVREILEESGIRARHDVTLRKQG
jgi:hypothetical protein